MKLLITLILSFNWSLCSILLSEEPDANKWELREVALIAKPEKPELEIDEKCLINIYLINNTNNNQQLKIAGLRDNEKLMLHYELKGNGYSEIPREESSYSQAVQINDSVVTVNLEPHSSKLISSEIVITPFLKNSATVYGVFKVNLVIDGIERETNGFSIFRKK